VNRRMKALLLSIVAVIVVVVLIFAYFASQPEVKWWKPEKEMEKPDVDFAKLNSTLVFIRTPQDNKSMNLSAGNVSRNDNFEIYSYLVLRDYVILSDFSTLAGNLTAYAERLSGDYILQKLVISYQYGSEKEYEYTGISYVDTYVFRGANLWYDETYNPHGGDNMEYLWDYEHKLVGVNKDHINAGFYGVSFALQIFLHDSLSRHLSHTIIFTVTAYYGQPSLLGWTDMHEVKTQVVLKIVPGGEKE